MYLVEYTYFPNEVFVIFVNIYIYICVCVCVCVQSVEKLHAQTSWGDKREQNKDLLSSNYMSNMNLCSAMDHRSGSD
jgi:hypothetical protein